MAVKKVATARKKATAKKAVAAKKPVAVAKKVAPAKKTVARKAAPGKTSINKGSKYQCAVCGMGITVDKTMGYVGLHEIICCGKAMKRKAK